MQHEISFISSDIASSLTANKALTSLFSSLSRAACFCLAAAAAAKQHGTSTARQIYIQTEKSGVK
jgi:hypothetical protein